MCAERSGLAGNWPSGVGRVLLDSIDSTNAEAMRRAPALTGPVWVVAGEQTAGRGRRARPWSSPKGNFYGTLVMQPEGPPSVIALRSFVAALALRDALVALTGLPQVFALKWPNDVLLNGGKLAGILLEGASSAGRQVLVIGIGINLIGAPDAAAVEPGAVPPVSILAETGIRITPGQMLDALAPAFAGWEARLVTEGFAPLRAEWLAHAARIGERIVARTGTTTREGLLRGIDESGALLLDMGRETVAIPAADVFF